MAVRLNDVDVACQACSSFVATDLWAVSETLLTEGPATRPGVTDPGYNYAAFFAGCFCFARDFAVDQGLGHVHLAFSDFHLFWDMQFPRVCQLISEVH